MPIVTAVEPNPQEPITEKDTGILSWEWASYFERWRQRSPHIETYSVSFDPLAVGANTTSEQTVTVTGVLTSDIVTVNKPSMTTGLGIVNARVSASDTVAITFMNTTAGSINPTSETYLIVATRL